MTTGRSRFPGAGKEEGGRTRLLASAVTLLEVFVAQQVASKRRHGLNEACRDFVQVFKLLQQSRDKQTNKQTKGSAQSGRPLEAGEGALATSLLIQSVCPKLKAFSLPSSLTSTCW